MKKIRVAIVGVGNCASSLVQGAEFYRNTDEEVPGIMHANLGGYKIGDIEFSAAFDIDKNKVGKDLSEAIFAKPNCTIKFSDVPNLGVPVMRGMTHDGLGKYLSDVIEKHDSPTVDVAEVLKKTKTDVVINYLPVGSEFATKWYVEKALEAGCGFINCIPVFIAKEKRWQELFEKKKLPIMGDDIKSQVGATIVHRVLANLFRDRGVKLERTMQLNVGGNSVTGDQEILIVINGQTKKMKIGDLIDSYADIYGEERTDGKDIVIMEKTKQDVKCFTIDDKYNVVLSKVDALIRHKISEPMYEITLEEGRKIRITSDHNVFVLGDDGDLENVPVKLLKENETYIAVSRIMPFSNNSEMTHVDITPYLNDLFSRGVHDGYIRVHNHPEIRIPIKFPVTDELLQIVGLWLADGNYDRAGSSNIELACGDEPECMEIIDKVSEELNINYNVRSSDGIRVRLISKTLAKIFRLALGLSGNAYTKRVPDWVFNLSPRQVALVLKGYVSGDGGMIGKQIRWTSISEGLIRDMQTLFMMVGINSTVFKEKTTPSEKRFRSSVEHFWHGLISSKEDVGLFAAKVGFLQEFKNKALLDAHGKLTKGNMHKIPNISLLKRWKIKSKNLHKTSSLRAHIVLSQLDRIKNESEREKVRNICIGDTRFLKIKNIRKISHDGYVYDISVKPFERFVCSNILIHNTDFLNMLERERLESKKISKTSAVTSQLDYDIGKENVHIGPSDYVPWLTDRKWAYIRLEGKTFGNVPLNIELKLEVWDSPNSAGVVIDAIRCAKLAMDRGIGGALISPSAYFMKSPPQQFTDDEAKRMTEGFIEGKVER